MLKEKNKLNVSAKKCLESIIKIIDKKSDRWAKNIPGKTQVNNLSVATHRDADPKIPAYPKRKYSDAYAELFPCNILFRELERVRIYAI